MCHQLLKPHRARHPFQEPQNGQHSAPVRARDHGRCVQHYQRAGAGWVPYTTVTNALLLGLIRALLQFLVFFRSCLNFAIQEGDEEGYVLLPM